MHPGRTATAIGRLRHRLGLPAQQVPADDPSPQSVLRCLEGVGVPGRMVELRDTDPRRFAAVAFPTLMRLGPRGWLLALGMDRRGLLVEDADGVACRVASAELAGTDDVLLYDRVCPPPADGKVWTWVLGAIRSHPQRLWQLALLAALVQALGLGLPQLARVLVDRAFPAGDANLMQVVVFGMIFVSLFQAWIGWLERRLDIGLRVCLDAPLDGGLLVHLLRLPYRFLERKSIAQLLQAFQGLATCRELLTAEALRALGGGLAAVALLAMMAQLMAAPALVVATVGVATLVLTAVIGRRQAAIEQLHVTAQIRERGSAKELFTHIAMLKAAGAERRGVRRWLDLLVTEYRLGLRIDRLALGHHTVIAMTGQILVQGLWLWGASKVLAGSLQLGELLAFTMMAGAFHAAVTAIGNALMRIVAAGPQLAETQSVLAERPTPLLARPPGPNAPGRIEIRDVWFRYGPTTPWIVKGLDLVVEPGSHYRVDGRSGSGKTTLLKIVAGLYEPARGSVSIGGETPAQARDSLSYLPQFVRLFNASILDNLRLFSGDAPEERLFEAAQLSGLARVVSDLPMGYDTILGQGGENFSGGQRQLIALTAVLASNRPLLLLDEAMANLDGLCRSELQRSPLLDGRTIIYTSHFEPEGAPYGASLR